MNRLSKSTSDLAVDTDSLFSAMTAVGTDFPAILAVLKSLQTKDDFLFIYRSFGVKKYWLTGLADGLVSRYLGDDLTLMGWFQHELSSDQMDQVNAELSRLKVDTEKM